MISRSAIQCLCLDSVDNYKRGMYYVNGMAQAILKVNILQDLDLKISDVAFDVLYVGDTSVIHQSLRERHQLLRKVVKPLQGRLELLLPEDGLNSHRPTGEKKASRFCG
eukprot:Gb_32665 [translate_table: standard]